MNNTYKKYIDEFMPSDEMRNYLKTQELTPYQIASLIFNSPYSIDQKKNAFYSLLSETDDSELKALCSNCIENIEKAYELLNTGGVFKVTSAFVNGASAIFTERGIIVLYGLPGKYCDTSSITIWLSFNLLSYIVNSTPSNSRCSL